MSPIPGQSLDDKMNDLTEAQIAEEPFPQSHRTAARRDPALFPIVPRLLWPCNTPGWTRSTWGLWAPASALEGSCRRRTSWRRRVAALTREEALRTFDLSLQELLMIGTIPHKELRGLEEAHLAQASLRSSRFSLE